ncbi:WxcM-like domain-containing protein [Nonlabens sp.]|uniref:WxcM-like domain-containing protein n=1 Tax=Nonlabens sp. TaxID=1888209 RepID=UPI001BCBA50F|nr:WxcM-like domain-containing protein [Nonlabens sp.]
MQPKLIKGGHHQDKRGQIHYNNEFDASAIKRIYTIENIDTSLIRAWQGHSIERRWFSAIQGAFQIKLIKIDDWEKPNPKHKSSIFELNEGLDILCVPPGFVSSIQALKKDSKLLAMSDYLLGEVSDEYRFDKNYFTTQ